MLNEIKEFEEYSKFDFEMFYGTDSKKTPQGGRIKANPFITQSGKNTGLKRPMIIISRHYMYADNDKPDFNKAEGALMSWLGKSKDIKEIDCWLPKYIEFLGEKCENSAKAQVKIDDLKKSKFERTYGHNNTENEIVIDDVLDLAFRKGPLKRYYLLIKDKKILDNIHFIKKDKDNIVTDNENDLNQVLKMASAILLSKQYTSTRFVPYSEVDICNWCVSPTSNKFYPECFIYIDNEDNTFKFFDIKENSAGIFGRKKAAICEKLEDSFTIVEEDELDNFLENNPGWIYYSDPGAGCNLLENTKYDI